MVIGKKNVRENKYHHINVKKPKWEKFSIFKHFDIPGTANFSDEIQAKIVFGS